MNNQLLQEAIVRVRGALENSGPSDPQEKHRLEQLLASLELQSETGMMPANMDEVMAEVSRHITLFEVEHPNLTGSLGQLMLALSSMGI